MEEIWKDIVGFKGFYRVSNKGNVFSARSQKPLTKSLHPRGYRTVALTKTGTWRPYLIHRLVAEAFIPNPDNKPMVNHINAVKSDNYVQNLEWVTHIENCQHAMANGLYASGDRWTARYPRGHVFKKSTEQLKRS